MEYKIMTMSDFEDSIDQFCNLYRKCFARTINTKIVRWRYIDNPINDLLVCFAFDKGRLVANYAASPCELTYKGQTNKVGLSLNTMTDPDYQGRGLFPDLASKLYAYMDEQEYQLIMGFPSYLSKGTFITKLDWTIMYELPTLELILSGFNRKLIGTDNISEDDTFQLNYGECRNENKTIFLSKTNSYLNWRYYQNTENHYKNFVIKNNNKVMSFLVCKEYQEKLNIVDSYFAEAQDIELLLCYAIEYAISLRKEKVTVWSQLGTKEHLIFGKYGFKNNWPITYFGCKILRNNKSQDIYDFRNWRIHAGDSNAY